jgi:hypothetical protein
VDGEFDPGAPLQFGLAEIRAAIPKHCLVMDPWCPMIYVLRDVVVVVLGLATAAACLDWYSGHHVLGALRPQPRLVRLHHHDPVPKIGWAFLFSCEF